MKKPYQFICLVLICCCSNNVAFSQIQSHHLETSKYGDNQVIQKLMNLHKMNVIEHTSESGSFMRALPLEGLTSADSANLQYEEVQYDINTIRIKPESVKSVFPEIVSTGFEEPNQIDYTSFIQILYEAIYYQQIKITELEEKIHSMESEKNKQ